MGKLILLIIIGFFIYWARKAYKSRNDVIIDDEYFRDTPEATVDNLIIYFKDQIDKIEKGAISKTKDAKEKLEYYNKELEKLTKVKESINK